VEAQAYAFFLQEMARWGYATFVCKMPLGLAVYGRDRAARLNSAYPTIQRWVLAGHSMGGGVGCDFVATPTNVRGLLLYATFGRVRGIIGSFTRFGFHCITAFRISS
jgi:pimeloyl-ACP methyl ester carboxylesterase